MLPQAAVAQALVVLKEFYAKADLFATMVGTLLVKQPLTFRQIKGFLTKQAKLVFVRIVHFKGFLTNKAPSKKDKHVYDICADMTR